MLRELAKRDAMGSTMSAMSHPIIFDRELVRLRRDRAAARFHEADFLVRRVMDDVVERLGFVNRTFQDVLCLGAYGGLPVRALRSALGPQAQIVAADLSEAMCAGCGAPVVQADEEHLPFGEGRFDCVVAPLTLQFVNDLPGTLIQIRRALRPDGLLLGAIAGGQTLHELAEAFAAAEMEHRGGVSPRVAPRADVRALGGLLQRAGFALPVCDVDRVTVTYGSALALMQDLRAMGAANALAERSRVPLTRGLLMRVCEIYQERYTFADVRVPATFDLITMTAWTPHPDQPQPLKPGSATHRLADALGAQEVSAGEAAPGAPEGGRDRKPE